MTLLAHVIEKHTSARFTSMQLLNSLFEDNLSDFDLFLTRIHYLCYFCAGPLIINFEPFGRSKVD